MKKMAFIFCLMVTQLIYAAGSRRLSILAQRASAQVQNNLNEFSTDQEEALLKRYEEILDIIAGKIPDDSTDSGDQLFYCDGGYINDMQGNDLDYISGGQQSCMEAIRGIFYCDGGYINNQEGDDLDYISGGQDSCLAAVRGIFYCDNGYVNDQSGKDLDYISGGQEGCLAAVKGEFYCDNGYRKNKRGETLDYISGGQEACIKTL